MYLPLLLPAPTLGSICALEVEPELPLGLVVGSHGEDSWVVHVDTVCGALPAGCCTLVGRSGTRVSGRGRGEHLRSGVGLGSGAPHLAPSKDSRCPGPDFGHQAPPPPTPVPRL